MENCQKPIYTYIEFCKSRIIFFSPGARYHQLGGSHVFVAAGNRSLSFSLSSSSVTHVRPSYDLATFLQHLRYSWTFLIIARVVPFSAKANWCCCCCCCCCCNGWWTTRPVRGRADCTAVVVAGTTNGNTRTQSPSESTGVRQSRPLPHTAGAMADDELHSTSVAVARPPRPPPLCCGGDDWRAGVVACCCCVAILSLARFDFHFSVAAAAKADGRPPPNRGPDAVRHAIRNSDRPVLHIGSPSKSNVSCNSGFFTWLSTSQSLPSAGLRFTCNRCNTASV